MELQCGRAAESETSAGAARWVEGPAFFLAAMLALLLLVYAPSPLLVVLLGLILPSAHGGKHDLDRRGAVAMAGARREPCGPTDFF
jgi:hypothetical protein